VIPHSRPTLGSEDVRAVCEALESGHLSEGPRVAAFEKAVASRLGRAAGVAASSGTAALALGLRALGVGPGDEVVLPAYACSALGHAVRFAGASPVLADVGDDLALDPEAAAHLVGERTRALVVVHPFGHPVRLGPFLEWGVPIVEDCAQALGATLDGRPAGSLGAVAVCSFYATKMIAAGEGGMLVSDGEAVLTRARAMRGGSGALTGAFNHKLSDLAAALGLAQLGRLDAFVARRREIAERYDAAFAGTGIRIPEREAGSEPCFSRYVVRVPEASCFIVTLLERGVEAKRPIADPLVAGAGADDLPEAARAFAECVSLPIYPSLADGEIAHVVGAVQESLEEVLEEVAV
jgi:dTDP-4-amino-4,6-dideoxygalactose transaminase